MSKTDLSSVSPSHEKKERKKDEYKTKIKIKKKKKKALFCFRRSNLHNNRIITTNNTDKSGTGKGSHSGAQSQTERLNGHLDIEAATAEAAAAALVVTSVDDARGEEE